MSSAVDEGAGEQDQHAVARAIILNALSRSPRTRRQLEDACRRRGVVEEVSRAVLDRMAELDLVDDEAFATAWVQSRQAGRSLGSRRLRSELVTRGIAPELAAQALADVLPEEEMERAQALVSRRGQSLRALPEDVRRRRLAGYLQRRGFDADVVRTAVEEHLAGGDQPQASDLH